ncbi:histidine kinase dimerization/phospho-acceptor domain-containing protein [Desulfosporosinus sp. PR]|nr:histidine kinase dimerization/phospho-acceptor domain-containing protein [Desulfosporosinus sp. PR]
MSIRFRLFAAITALVILFVSVAWFLNTKYLGSYYISERKKSLLMTGEHIVQIYNGDPGAISLQLTNLERTSGLAVMILDGNYTLKYDSELTVANNGGQTLRVMPAPEIVPGSVLMPAPVNGGNIGKATPDGAAKGGASLSTAANAGAVIVKKNVDGQNVISIGVVSLRLTTGPQLSLLQDNLSAISEGQPVFAVTQDPDLRENVLNLAMRLSNGDFLLMDIPIAVIQDSVAIANRFFLYTGLLTILIGSLAAFMFSVRFTKPILELSNIARKMSGLDFTVKYKVSQNDELGELGRSINLLSDQLDQSISQLKANNRQLLLDIEREHKLEETRKEFISSVSHELKTPIALIQGYAEGLQDNVVEDEENKNYYCGVIIDEADRMDKLVKDLLSLFQLESGYFRLEKSVFDITSLIDRVLGKCAPIFKSQSIHLQVEKDDNAFVEGDPARIEQVVFNYINNALNHLDERGLLKISQQSIGNKVRVAVFNSGETIPTESMEEIWRSFYKIDKARTRAQGGSGLGLSIVRAIQELHGNDYGVINLEDGVMFWFETDAADPREEVSSF